MHLDHTIISARDRHRSAAFLAEILGLPPARQLGHFAVVRVGPTSIDFVDAQAPIAQRHFAFLVSEAEFDAIFARIRAQQLPYWADPGRNRGGQINHWDDGRGLYFDDPDGHLLEILTRPYGSGGPDAEHPHPLLEAQPAPSAQA